MQELMESRIPRILHYCFGMAPNFGGKPWGLLHYVCLRSAVTHVRPSAVHFYHQHEPSGPWWDLTRPLVTLHKIEAPQQIFGNRLYHPAHQTDVVRLEKLIEWGGIYLDADVIVVKDFAPLLDDACVMGQQGEGGEQGLCNGVILAAPNAPFLKRWHDAFRYFRSKGRDQFWDEHAVQVPGRLAREFPDELTILHHKAFFWPLWHRKHLELMFASTKPLDAPGAYAHHLWESQAWEDFLGDLTVRKVRAVETNFNRMAREHLAGLPDDFCEPQLGRRFQRSVRRFRRRLGREIQWQGEKLGRLVSGE